MNAETTGVVIYNVKVADNRFLTTLFSRDVGALTLSVPISRRKRHGSNVELFQPLSIVDITYSHKPGAKIYNLVSAQLHFVPQTIPFSQEKLALAFFLADMLKETIREEQRNEALYAFLVQSIVFLDSTRKPCANFHIVFLLQLLSFLGIQPNLSNDNERRGDYLGKTIQPNLSNDDEPSAFDLVESCFTTERLPSHEYLLPHEAQLLPTLFRLTFHNMHLLRLTHTDRQKIIRAVLKYYSYHVPSFRLPRSFDVLTDLFAH